MLHHRLQLGEVNVLEGTAPAVALVLRECQATRVAVTLLQG